MIHTGVTSTGCRRAARRIRAFTPRGRSRNAPRLARGASGLAALEDGLEVEHRGAVDVLERTHPESTFLHRPDPDPMEPDRVRAVRRAGAEHAGERTRRVAPWMHLEDSALRLVQPRQDHELVVHDEPGGAGDKFRQE